MRECGVSAPEPLWWWSTVMEGEEMPPAVEACWLCAGQSCMQCELEACYIVYWALLPLERCLYSAWEVYT